jgi:hypothetical protein
MVVESRTLTALAAARAFDATLVTIGAQKAKFVRYKTAHFRGYSSIDYIRRD